MARIKRIQNEGSGWKTYKKGWIPIPDSRWKVEMIENHEFITLGEIKVSGKQVSDNMDAHRSVRREYGAHNIALKMAYEKFAKRLKVKDNLMEPLIVTEIEE